MIWKNIDGYEQYEVSNTGIIRNKNHNTYLVGSINNDGYIRVKLTKADKYTQNVFIHRIVANAFLDKMDCDTEINHIDKDKTNNHVNNLEWCNHTHNMRHSCDKKIICLNDNFTYPSARDAALYYNLNPMSVREVARGVKNSIHGMRFDYIA